MVFICYMDIYIVMMVASDDNESECVLTCRLLYGAEEAALTIKRFMGQPVQVRPASNSVVFACGQQIGRVSVPEMELEYQEDSGHAIVDFDVSETSIFTT